MKKIIESQSSKILRYLKKGKSITSLEALRKFGCFRLSGRIYDLRKDGHKIFSQFVRKNDKVFSEYYMKR